MSAETVKVLRDARALIAKPEHWTRFVYSRVSVCGLAYCMGGAVDFVAPDHDAQTAARLALGETIGTEWPSMWNDEDGRTHAEVLAAFDRTIARLETAAS